MSFLSSNQQLHTLNGAEITTVCHWFDFHCKKRKTLLVIGEGQEVVERYVIASAAGRTGRR